MTPEEKRTMAIATTVENKDLFSHLATHHDRWLLGSELDDIRRICQLEAEHELSLLRCEVQRLEAKSQWIPVSDSMRLPDDDMETLIQTHSGSIFRVRLFADDDNFPRWIGDNCCFALDDATHWMEITPPPEGN